MLTGGVAGSVFASPPTASILAAIRAVAENNPGSSYCSYSIECVRLTDRFYELDKKIFTHC